MLTTKKTVCELKEDYVKYYVDVPVQKYAAMYIGRDEDTIIRWRKDDLDFADAVLRARAEWVRKQVIRTKAEFALERLEKEVFSSIDRPIEISLYDRAVQDFQDIDPNAPQNKRLVDETLTFLMEKTKWKTATSP